VNRSVGFSRERVVPIDGLRLSIDFGTTNTAAALRWPDGRTRSLLFDGAPTLTSAVFAGTDGILVGRPAIHAARAYPHCFEPHPKRCIDHGRVMLGPADGDSPPTGVLVTELIGAVLGRVADEVIRTAGRPANHVVLTYPAGWGPTRRRTLLAAAQPIFGDVSLVPEPVAAASHFVALPESRVPPGACVMVYDLGAGTFDVSVIRRTDTGFTVLAADGLADAGGLDIDAAVMAHLGTIFSRRDAATWSRLTDPATAADRRASRLLWDDIRTAKEMLSHTAAVHLHIPLFDDEVPLGREELERLAHPILDRTVDATRSALNTARIAPATLAVAAGSRSPPHCCTGRWESPRPPSTSRNWRSPRAACARRCRPATRAT
jgi:molecular chaperone DnaK